jgi:hypothetical protein
MIAVLLGATIGVPYLVSRSSRGTNTGTGSWPVGAAPLPSAADLTGAPLPSTVIQSPGQLPVSSPGSLVYTSPAPLEGMRFHSIDQVLRFDVTREWVYRNWERKSTGPTDVGLFSVRVPLVSGTHATALAGSLTYYFNQQGQVEHISFHGTTGDTTELVNFLTRTYQLERVGAPAGEQLFQVKRDGRVQSELRTRPESVLWATSPHTSFSVELELARPGSPRFLPSREPRLEIPQVASPVATAPPPTTAPSSGAPPSGNASGANSYFDDVRYATPQEEGQVLWKRWPN